MTKEKNKKIQPVVVVVGHIDHGKTTLLDTIRKSRVAEKETGGITQGISAYEIAHTPKEGSERKLTFIDTPGHEAFKEMRKRGASVADIAILVVAADDGVKPQTKEAWKAIEKAGIPSVVAFTKIDKDNANLSRAQESVLKEGIYLEGLGGSIPQVSVSGKTGDGIDELLDLLLLVTDLEDIHCNPLDEPKAVVIESSRDPRQGVSATIIVRSGTFTTGSFAVTDGAWAPLRSFQNSEGKQVKEIICGMPARVAGFSTEPRVGSAVTAVSSKKEAEKAAAFPVEAPLQQIQGDTGDKKSIRLILKADTAGGIEALEYELGKIDSDDVELMVVDTGVGSVSENDVKRLVGFDEALVIGFNVKTDASAQDLADRQGVAIETRPIIYELSEWLSEKVTTLSPKNDAPETLGKATILKHFSTTGNKHVVGGRVDEGTIVRGNQVMIQRRGIEVGLGKITNLQSQRADVESVAEGAEFGAQIDTKFDVTGGDVVVMTK